MNPKALGLIAASVLATLAAWPFFVSRQVATVRASALPAMAPVEADYKLRDQQIAFYESAVHLNHPNDMFIPRVLAGQYMMRYREQGNIDDVLRARNMAQLSLKRDPIANVPADDVMASALLTLHQFYPALKFVDDALKYQPTNTGLLARQAGLNMEVGDYAKAERILAAIPKSPRENVGLDTEWARYDELTNHLAKARTLVARAQTTIDTIAETPAATRAWFHFREGQLAFEAGDLKTAIADEHQAIAMFPNDQLAWNQLAKFEWASKDWKSSLAAAKRAAEIIPLPETLGYEVDADRALGDESAAAQTNDLIGTIEKIGNTQHVADRLIAMYYADHHLHPHDAYRIALRELKLRDDIYTEDTIAWTAAMDGKWDIARTASAKALRWDTPDALLRYHAGVIALHFGDRASAKREFSTALRLNPSFHPFFADDARKQLATL
ncbi:MAG: tetratricopeptide repeat protein [Vulcanimicrobiaceae bacterium]